MFLWLQMKVGQLFFELSLMLFLGVFSGPSNQEAFAVSSVYRAFPKFLAIVHDNRSPRGVPLNSPNAFAFFGGIKGDAAFDFVAVNEHHPLLGWKN